MNKRSKRYRQIQLKNAAILFFPAVICIGTVVIFPLFYSLVLSFTDTNLRARGMGTFIGLENYITALTDEYFLKSIVTTLQYTVVSVIAELCVGYMIAGLLNKVKKGREFFFSIIIIPMMISCVAVGMIWRLLLHPELGIVNYLIELLGGTGRAWYGDAKYALGTLIFIDVWQETPYMTLLILAGLVSLPKDPYEAARIEGANVFQTFQKITLPLMKPTLIVATLLRAIGALKTYDLVYVITKGGPGTSTEVMTYNIYKQAYQYLNTGRAAAMSYILLAIILVISIFFVRIGQEKQE